MNNRIKIYLIALLSVFTLNVSAQNNNTYKFISNNSMEITSIIKSNNKYFILLNESTYEFDQINSIILITNNNLEILDTISIPIPDYYYVAKFLIVDSNIVVYGMSDSLTNNLEFGNLFIAKLNFNGKLISYKYFQNQYLEIPRDIIYYKNRFYITSNTMINNSGIRYYGNLKILDDSLKLIDYIVDSSMRNIYFDRIDVLSVNELAVTGAYIGDLQNGARTIVIDTLLNIKNIISDSTLQKDQLNIDCKSWLSASTVKINNKLYNLFEYDTRSHLNPNSQDVFKRIGIKKTNSNGLSSIHLFHFDLTNTDKPLLANIKNNNIEVFGTLDNHSVTNQPNRNGNLLYMVIDTNMNILRLNQFGDNNYQQLRGVLIDANKYLFYGFEKNYVLNKKIPYIYKVDNIDTYTTVNNTFSSNLNIYPNPTKDKLHININERANEVYLLNSLGQRIEVDMINNEIDLSEFSDGVYYLFINTNSGLYKGKVVKN